jgi:tetratricopeptide (TPR) repeat protein
MANDDAQRRPSPPSRRADVIAIAVLIALVLIAMGKVVAHEFVEWDDPLTIVHNPWLNPPTLASLLTLWRGPRMDIWIPLTYTAWWAVAKVAGIHAPAFHLLNLALHAAVVAGVFALLRRLRFRMVAAGVGAALFAVHPVQVESVAWASGTKDVLSGLLAIAALYAYVTAVDADDGNTHRARYIVGAALMLLAMLAKPSAMVVPLLAAVIDGLVLRRPWRRVAVDAGVWMLIALPLAALAAYWQTGSASAEQQVSPWLRPLVASDAVAFYLAKIVWPARLGLDYGRSPAAALGKGLLYWTWIIPALAAAAAVVLARRRRSLLPLAVIVLFIMALAPVSGLAPSDFQYYSTVADHYLYLPMLAVALAAAGVMSSRERSRPALMVAAIIVIVLALRTGMQMNIWCDTRTLFAHARTINPTSVAAYINLAVDAGEHDRPEDAVRLARLALELRPNNVQALTTLGAQEARLGRLDAAEEAFRRAVDHASSSDARPLANLAGLLAQRGRLEEALPMVRRAIEIDPELAQARANYAVMLANSGQPGEALRQLELAVRLDPSDSEAGTNLAAMLADAGRTREAVELLRRVLARHPNHAHARDMLEALSRPAAVPR